MKSQYNWDEISKLLIVEKWVDFHVETSLFLLLGTFILDSIRFFNYCSYGFSLFFFLFFLFSILFPYKSNQATLVLQGMRQR